MLPNSSTIEKQPNMDLTWLDKLKLAAKKPEVQL